MYISIIVISIIILILALFRYKSCMSLISDMHYSNSWKSLFAIIWFFVAGYAFYGYSLIANHAFASDHLLIVIVFFLGSIYVLLVTNLNHKIFAEIAALQKEAKHYTEHLEEEVRARTKELEELSITDNLTNLKNQRFFYEKLKEEIYRANRQGHDLFLLLFDIDNFKRYNDTHGHLAGDKVLQTVGAIITQNIRDKVDSGCRYAGDEFTVILPDTNKEQALTVAKRIIKELNKHRVQVSMGLIPCKEIDSNDPQRMLKIADMAMYSAKAEGGNRIKVFCPRNRWPQRSGVISNEQSCV